MTINNELFTRRPLGFEIPNDGVTNVDRPDDSNQWRVLEYELTSFVSEGEYEHGLERILDSYIRHRSSTTQPAAWVSGFYGSGKSHLVRVLQHLWADTALPNGASARGLVNLPQGIKDQFVELSTIGKRDGVPPWSAAGALDRSGDTLNAVFLAIVLGAAGLPTRVAPAQVALWLAGRGDLDAVRTHVEAAGADFIEELSEYNLSTRLADAILTVDPRFAASGADVRKSLRTQFAPESALNTDETIALFRKVLQHVGGGAIPPTLIVLDEVQQYISGDGGRAMEVQNLVESVSRELDGRVLLVATGQQELTADATLQKIQDRFTVKVVLKNQDVDAVVRRVLLNKEPAQRSTLESALAGVAGEISRQLVGSKIQHIAQDDADLVEDYPILPSRRRFWESVLRQADAGRAGQLRSQLRIVHDANRRVASKPVGTVVGADYLYSAKHEDLNGAGLLLKETQRLIHEQGQKEPLRGRVLGLIQLISLLPTTAPGDIGVRAKADHLVDLLVEDLTHDGTALRQEVPKVLAALAAEGVLQQDGDEYRLQTAAGRAWDEAFRRHRAQLENSSEITGERDDRLRAEVEKALPSAVPQGKAKVARKLALRTGNVAPTAADTIPVWLRSEWDDGTTSKQFDDLAKGLGPDSPVVLVHLPRAQAQAFAAALRNQIASERTLDQQGIPQDDEGKQARRAMETRRARAQAQVNDHIRDIVSKASVQLGGGSSPTGTALRDRIENGAQSATTRLFSRFGDADDARWSQVIDRIKKGSGADALKQVGYDADPEQHPVVKEILGRISGAGTPASDVEKAVLSTPFGWPRDALMGAIGVLLDIGLVRATINGSDASTDNVLSQTRLGTVHLRRESTVLRAAEKIAARSLLSKLGVTADNDTLVAGAEQAVTELSKRAASIGGPAPLPDTVLPAGIDQIKTASGNDRVHALLAAKDDLTEFADRLDTLDKRRQPRLEALSTARALASAAAGLQSAGEARSRLDAFEQTRELLADNNQINPIATDLASAVREAVASVADSLEASRKRALDGLANQPAWASLDSAKQEQLLDENKLSPEPKPALSDATAVVEAVRARPLSSWGAEVDAVPARAAKALEAALRLTAPKAGTVTLPTATISTADEIEAYLDDLRVKLTQSLTDHDTVVVKG